MKKVTDGEHDFYSLIKYSGCAYLIVPLLDELKSLFHDDLYEIYMP